MPRIAIVANEPSGDTLGAALMRALKRLDPEVSFDGVGGPQMAREGLASRVPLERLAVMGLAEVVRHLPGLLRIRRELATHFERERPDLFVGIDAPDFNLGLERRLRRAGIPTVHLVSPTVWAWRPGRVKALRDAVDLLLSIFPFELEFLERHAVPTRYIGHPLADEIEPLGRAEARIALGLKPPGPLIALLPGSRAGEMRLLADPFVAAAQRLLRWRPDSQFLAPMVSSGLRAQFAARVEAVAPELPVRLLDGDSRRAIAASDLVLAASGTATLETLLLRRPMVVGYRVHWLTYALVKGLGLIKVPHVAMANLLAGEALAPERLQHRCTGDALAEAAIALLEDPARCAEIEARYAAIGESLRRDASTRAAEAILELIGRGGD